jgi:hypothetical protein
MKNLLVTGTYRSGTTLLQKMLDVHPDMGVIFQPALPLFKRIYQKFAEENLGHSIGDLPLGLRYHIAAEEDGYLDMLDHIIFDQDTIREIIAEIGVTYSTDLADGTKNFPKGEFLTILANTLMPGPASVVLVDFFKAISLYRNTGKTVYVGFKEVYVEWLVPPLLKLFGNEFKVVTSLRDPRGILASRNYGSYASEARGFRHPLLFLAEMWRTSARYHHQFEKQFPGQIISFRFENMVSDLTKTSGDIARHLELDECKAMSDPFAYRNEDGELWKKNTSHNSITNKNSATRWKDLVPNQVLGALEFLCWLEMPTTGYVPSRSFEQAQQDFLSYSEDSSANVPWTRTKDFELDKRRRKMEIHRVNFGLDASL